MAAETPLPEPGALVAAKATTVRSADRCHELYVKLNAAEAAADAHDKIAPPLFGRGRHNAEGERLAAKLEKTKTAHRLAVEKLYRAQQFEARIQSGFDKSERDRRARAEPYRRRLRIVHEARSMLARVPRLAAFGAPYIMARAGRKLAINPQAKDIWGIPLTPPDAVI